MNLFQEFLSQYGTMILYTIITAIVSYLGLTFKRVYEKIAKDKTKKVVVKTCVEAIEQIYKELHGEEKFQKCVEAATEMLAQKGIIITDLELKMLIESAVKNLNDWIVKVDEEESEFLLS